MTASAARLLVELQKADVDILRAEKRLEELPERAAILEVRAKMRDTTSIKEKAAVLERKLAGELKARQDEIAMHTQKIAAEQAKVMETSDHRQIQAITREMDGLRRRVDKLEMESLQFMERAEKAKAQRTTIEAHLEKLGASEARLIGEFRAAGGALQDEIAALKARRQKIAGLMPAELVDRYERVRESKGGLGVGELSGSTCTACHMSLPAERVASLESGPDIGVCPQCRRLIVVRSGAAE